MSTSSLTYLQTVSLADAAFAASSILWDDHEGGESSGEEVRDKLEPEQVQSITKTHPLLTELLNQTFTCLALASVRNTRF